MSDRDVSVVLDVGMGSGISIGFTFVLWYYSCVSGSESLREIQGTEKVFMKFMKTHVFIECIKNVIKYIDSDIDICFPNIVLKFEDDLFKENGQLFEKQPDAIFFNNAQIENIRLHNSIRKVNPMYLLTIRTENFNFGGKLNLFVELRNANYHQTALFHKGANFQPSEVVVLKRFDSDFHKQY